MHDIMYWVSPFCTQGTHMPSSGSFVTMYLAELHFGNGYMEIGLLISNLHGTLETQRCLFLSELDKKGQMIIRVGFRVFFIVQKPIKVFLYLSGCGLANSSTEVDCSFLLNPVCRGTESANKVL